MAGPEVAGLTRIAAVSAAGGGAAIFVQRLAREPAVAAEVVLADGPLPAGTWRCAWRVPDTSAGALGVALQRILDDGVALAVLDDSELAREVAGRLTARSGVAVVGRAVGVRLQQGGAAVTRHAENGDGTASLLVRTPAVILVDPETLSGAPETVAGSAAEERLIEASPACGGLALLRELRLLPWEMDVTDADVIVAGGRGVGGPEGFRMLADLAGLLGGTVAASRVAVDAGWIPYERQIGLTGKTVSPRLYIACGISGAVHHTLGMRNSGQIVAINSDAQAPIFKIATVSVVADVHAVVPSLIEQLRRVLPARSTVGAAP